MSIEATSREAVWQVLKDYGRQYAKYPLLSIGTFVFPATGNIFIFFIPPLIIAELVNLFAHERALPNQLETYVLLFAGSWLLGELFWRIGLHSLIKLEARSLKELGTRAFQHLAERDYDFYTSNFVGSLTKKATAYSRNFESFTDTFAFTVISNLFPIIFATIVLSRYSWWLPLVLLLSLAGAILAAIPIVRKRSRLVAMRHAAASKVSGDISDVITNMLAVKSFAKEEEELKLFGADLEDYVQKFKKAANYQNLRFDVIISPLYVFTNVVGLVAAIWLTRNLGLQAGTIIVVFSYYSQISRVFWEISRVYRSLESAVSEGSEFTQLFLEPARIRDQNGASALTIQHAAIEFKNVRFRYIDANGSAPFLNNFNLIVKGGERVGLVGPSGGGKTTITKLLLRFVDPETGAISIDNQEIQAVSLRSLREAIAYVPQEPLLFHRSLFENIAYARMDATEREVIRAAELAHADEFIRNLPSGYQTLVGERGVKLSGGQRQRVAIARALLKQAPILILDEATSSLDSESESFIQEGLWELMRERTAIVIAHRLSTIRHMDRILVLEQGRIVEDGNHEHLLMSGGIYAKLWNHQSGGFVE